MARNNDSIGNTLLVIIVLCLVCSIIVAGSAVGLKARQEQQKQLDKQYKILEVTGLMQPHLDMQQIEQRYQQFIEPRLIELRSGHFIDQNPSTFDMAAALKDPAKSRDLPAEQDPAGIRRVSEVAEIYLVKDLQGKVNQVVLPVYGNGLWSVMYAFLAVSTDGETVKGITFYEHGETPGLGGEIENLNWQKGWVGKKLFDPEGNVVLHIVKGSARADDVNGIDGLSGATLTTNGVQHTMQFWLGNNGYGPFLKKVRAGELNNG